MTSGRGPQRSRGGRGPAPRAASDHRGDVGHVGQLERARARQDRPAGHARQGGGARVAQDVRGIRGAHASQGQTNVHVGAHARADRPRGALRRGDQVKSEAAPLRRQPQEDIHRGGMRVGQDAELVDRDDQARGRGRDGPGIGLVGALPGRQVRQGELAERGLAPQEERGDPVEGARGGPRVEVRQQRLRVGQVGQARKGGPALVVDEDETHALGRIAVGDRGEPAQQRLRLARARTAGHEGVRSVRDQVEGHGSRLGSPDDDAEASGNPLGVAGIPVQARGQCVLVIGTRDGPPPPGGHGLLVGDAHARAPRGQVGDASRVADVEDGRGLLVRGRASAGRASFPVGHVDVDALGSQEDGRAGVPPDARPSHLGGHLSRAPQRAFGAVSADDAEGGGIPRLGGGLGRQGDARAEPAGPTGPHGGPPGRWGSARVRKRGEHEGEGCAVPPASAPPRASNPRDRAGAREEGDDGGADPQCLRARDEGVQAPCHERTHDDDGDEGGSAQE